MTTKEVKLKTSEIMVVNEKRIRISLNIDDERIVRVFLHDYFVKFIHEKNTGEFIGTLSPKTNHYDTLDELEKARKELQELGVWIEVEEFVTSS